MKRFWWLVVLSLTAALGLLVKSRVVRPAEPSAGQPGSPELKGHRWFAAIYDLLNACCERRLLSQVRPWIAGQATGRVLEIGAGTGANFPYYRAAEQIVAIEPDPYMLRRARKRAAELGLNVEFHRVPAEVLPFADASFDTVVATLALCTVADPARSMAEARRVVKPRGTFRFIEHVRARDGSLARLQDTLTPLWHRLGAGCHLNRRTADAITVAGFEIAKLEQVPSLPLVPLIAGVARPAEDMGVRDEVSSRAQRVGAWSWLVAGALRPVARAGGASRAQLVVLGALALLIGLSACQAAPGQRPATDGPRLSLQERSHDFGAVSASQKAEHRFPFTNTGNRPLQVDDVRLEPARPGG